MIMNYFNISYGLIISIKVLSKWIEVFDGNSSVSLATESNILFVLIEQHHMQISHGT